MKKGRISESPSLTQALSLEQLQEHLSQSEKSREHLQAEIHQLQGFLWDKEEHCSALGQRVLSFSERVRELESALGASSSRVTQLQETHTAEVKQLLLTHAQELERARLSSFTQGRRVGLDQGTSSGIRDCKSNLLMTPQGQSFLDSFVQHLPEAYLHTPDFWLRMLDPLTEWTATAILECCQQLGIPEQAASINAGPIMRMFKTEPETLKRNHFLFAKEPWFMHVLREASQVLCQPTQPSEKLPPWDAPRFPLFPLNTMVMRSIRKAFDEESREHNALDLPTSGEGTSSAFTSRAMADDSGERDVPGAPASSSKGIPFLVPAMTSPASGGRTSSSHSSGSKDLASTSDPSL